MIGNDNMQSSNKQLNIKGIDLYCEIVKLLATREWSHTWYRKMVITSKLQKRIGLINGVQSAHVFVVTMLLPEMETFIFLLFCSCFVPTTAELCALSEYRIYPGNGKLMIRRDGKPIWLGTSKAFSLTIQRKKAAKLVWTQAWRRLHKKGLSETTTKKRVRRANKVQRAVVGASLEDIRKKASEKNSVRSAAREVALKEMKERKAANKAKSGGKGKAAPQSSATFQKVPKHMGGMGGGRAKRGGALR